MKQILFGILILSFIKSHAQIDYRNCQSPVKDQLYRGTCTAFSVCAAMETFAGVPTDLSEQYIYAQVKSNQIVQENTITPGSFLKLYQQVIAQSGTLREDEMPYNGNSILWSNDEDAFEKFKKEIAGASLYKILMFPDYTYSLKNNLFEYLDQEQACQIQLIKNKLDSGVRAIPVSYVLPTAYWGSFMDAGKAYISLNDMVKVQAEDGGDYISFNEAKLKDKDVLSKMLTGKVKNDFIDSMYVPNAGHAVCIVGYTNDGFIIKNSWSEAWGDKGYGIITFDYHTVFCKEALVIKAVTLKTYSEKENDVFDRYDINLKAVPEDVFGTMATEFSLVYKGTGKPPQLSEIKYRVYLTGPDNHIIEVEKGAALAYNFNYEYGYSKIMLTGFSYEKTATAGYKVCVDVSYKLPGNGKVYTNTYKNIGATNCEIIPEKTSLTLDSLKLK